MASLFRTNLKLARASIKANRARSFLTCLGIAIGVASIILILSLMGSVSSLVKSEIKTIGDDLIVVRPNTTKDSFTSITDELTGANTFTQSNLTLNDVSTIANTNGVVAASPVATAVNTVVSEKNTLSSVPILGTNPDFLKIESYPLRFGSFISENDEAKTVVLGFNLSLTLFNTMNSTVGKTVTILGEKFIVTGVLDRIDQTINFNNIDLDNTLIMNTKNLSALSGSIQIQQINVKAITTDSVAEVAQNIAQALTDSKHGDTNFSVSYGDAISHPGGTLFDIVSGILTLVAAISLIVGGIGIMNIMLVSVSERNHEIGIRKAVGASSRNILIQFLCESLILSLLGGAFGLILGYILAFLISLITPFAPFISLEILLVTFLTSLIIGIVFGIYPALKAASKNPIESLKHYR